MTAEYDRIRQDTARVTTQANGPAENPLLERLRAASMTSAQIKNMPPPEPLIAERLQLDSLALMYGPSGVGKSFLAVDMALHVAYGSWWQGQAVTGGPVLYVVGEGASGVGMRVDAWERHNRLSKEVHPFTWLPRAVNVFDLAHAGALRDFCREVQPALIVLDTLNRCAIGAEENSAKDVGRIIDNLHAIREATGACVLLVHHHGKDTSAGARGSSALKGGMHTELEVTGDSDQLRLFVAKQKDGPDGQIDRLRLVTVTTEIVGSDGMPITSCVVDRAGDVNPDTLPERLAATLEALEAIDDVGGIATSIWAKQTQLTERTFYRHRKGLVDTGLVVNVGTDKTPRYRPAHAVEKDGSDG